MSLPEDLAGFSREELIELVGRLFGHIQVLEARIAELEGQQKPPTGVGSRRLGSRPTGPPAPRENGGSGPTALAGDGRSPPTGWNTPRPVAPTARCSDRRECAGQPPGDHPASGTGAGNRTRGARACPKCRKRWAPEPDWSAITVGRQRFGHSVQSEVSVLREECRLPFRVIQRYLKWRFGLGLSVGELVDLVRGAGNAKRFGPARWCTGTKRAGADGYLWSFSTPKVRYFLSGRRTRGCWQRLLRSLQRVPGAAPEVLGVTSTATPSSGRWPAHAVREVYDHAQTYPEPGPNLPETVQRAQRVEQQQRYQQWLWSICKPYLGSDAPMRVLCQRVEASCRSCSPSSLSPGPARTTSGGA